MLTNGIRRIATSLEATLALIVSRYMMVAILHAVGIGPYTVQAGIILIE